MSPDPNDLVALTPAHFLIGQEMFALPELNVGSVKQTRLSSWQHLAQIKQHFWQRWSEEYLPLLQKRVKWQEAKASLKVGDMVLVQNDNCPPLSWPLGRVIDVTRSRDNRVRSVKILTQSGEITRAIQRVCVLPM